MDYSIYRLNLDVKTNRSQALLKVFKGDTAVKLVCMLTDGGRVFQLKDGNVATITLTMPDKSKPTYACYIHDNSIVYTFTDETTNIGADSSGMIEAQLNVYGGVVNDTEGNPIYSQTLAMPKFSIEVSATANKPTNPIFEGINTSVGIVLGAAAQESARMLAENEREENEKTRQDSYTVAEKTAKEAKEIALSAIPIPPDVVLGNKGAVVVRDADGKYSFARCSSNGAINSVVVSDEKGRITLNNYPEQPTHATNKNYVDLGLSQTAFEARNYTDEKVEASHHDIEKRLEQLESATLKYTEYSGVTDAVPVPDNAAKMALVNKVGGMTYKSKNLIPYPYIDASLPNTVGTSTTLYGVTFTLNADRSLTLNGVSEVYFDIYFTNAVSFTKGISISFGTPLEGLCEARYDVDSDGFLIPEHIDIGTGSNVVLGAYDATHVYLSIFQGATFNNVTIRPMLADSDVVLPYSDNFEGLRDTKVTELMSEGANCLPFPYKESSQTEAGLTYRIREDGGIEVSGTPTGYSDMMLAENLPISYLPTVFTMSQQGNSINMAIDFSIKDINYGVLYSASIDNDKVQDVDLSKYPTAKFFTCTLKRKSANTACSGVVYPMVNHGTTAAPYKPYRAEPVGTFHISEPLRAFLEQYGYGRGIKGYGGYIDLEKKQFIPPRTFRKVLDGSEDWYTTLAYDGESYNIKLTLGSDDLPLAFEVPQASITPIICNGYASQSRNNVYTTIAGCASADVWIAFYDPNYNTFDISLWKAHLAQLYKNETPLIIEYATASAPEPINISAFLTDDEIEVEGGGTIVPVNTDYNNAAFVEMLFTEKK